MKLGHASSIRRPARGRGEPEPVQQVRGATQRIWHAEEPREQRRDPGQRPPLVFIPPVDGRVGVQGGAAVPADPRPACSRSVRRLRHQRRLAAGPLGTPPLVHRFGCSSAATRRSARHPRPARSNCAVCNRALSGRDRHSAVSPPPSGSDTSQRRVRPAGNANHAGAPNAIKQTKTPDLQFL